MLPQNTQAPVRTLGLPIPAVDRDTGYPSDVGCYVHPSCLTCPLPRCVFEQDAASPDAALGLHHARQRQVRLLHAQGVGPSAIAAELRCSRMTVYRLLVKSS